jgi:peptidase M1-like protein
MSCISKAGVSIVLAAWTIGAAVAQELPTEDLGALLDSFRGLQPASSGFAAAGKRLTIGRLSLILEDGALFPVRGKGDELLGLMFEGQGRYEYLCSDPRDRAVLPENLTRNAPLLLRKESTVLDSFKRFVVFFARPMFEEQLTGEPRALPSDGQDTFARIWKRIGLTHLEYDHLAAEARINPGGLQFAYAEIEGAGELVGYKYDRVRYFTEGLVAFRKLPNVEYRFPIRLSLQDLETPADGVILVRVRNASVRVATQDNRSATIDSELLIEPNRDGLRLVTFLLMNNRAPASIDWAATKNQLKVRRVVDGAGNELRFSHRYNELLVQLRSSSKKGARSILRVETEGEILTDMSRERHEDYIELFSVPWFPQPFRADAGEYTFQLTARTHKPFYPVASGTTTVREDGDYYLLESKSDRPVYLVGLFAGRYKTFESMVGAVRVRVHAYLTMSPEARERFPAFVADLLRFYQEQLGPYPFEELDLVGVPEITIGTPPSGMVLLPEDAYKSLIVAGNRSEPWMTERHRTRVPPAVVAHEIAHQWFGHRAAPSRPQEAWLSESFAEYMAGLAMGASETSIHGTVGFKDMLADWRAVAPECADAGALDSASILGGEKGSRDSYCLLYSRGPLVLHMFRTMVGDENFFRVLRKLLERANYGPTTTADLKQVVKETLHSDMSWFFDQWFSESGIPTINVDEHVVSSGSGYALSGKVEQLPDAFKKMVIPFLIEYPGGSREVKLVVQETPHQAFSLPLAGKPSSVKVDPSGNNLAIYK